MKPEEEKRRELIKVKFQRRQNHRPVRLLVPLLEFNQQRTVAWIVACVCFALAALCAVAWLQNFSLTKKATDLQSDIDKKTIALKNLNVQVKDRDAKLTDLNTKVQNRDSSLAEQDAKLQDHDNWLAELAPRPRRDTDL